MSKIICALKLIIDKLDVLLINVYMPCDTGVINGELIEYNDVTAELNQLILCSCSQHVIIAGDFNTDITGDNAQTKSLLSFVDEGKLCLCIITGIEHMIKTCEIYADKHFIQFNVLKSKLLIFGEKMDNPNIKVKGEVVPVCTKAKYLGNILSTTNDSDMINEGIQNFNINLNIFLSKFGTCKVLVKDKLFNQYCCSYYGSQLWPLYNQDFKNVCTKWRKAIRRIWGLPFNTHCNLLPLISEQNPIEIALTNRFVKFFKSLLDSDNCMVSYMARLQSQNCRSIFGQNARHAVVNYNLFWHEIETGTTNVIQEDIYDTYFN